MATTNFTTNFTTIITAYFEINSKYPKEQYDEWMQIMLRNIATPMIIFCDAKSGDKIRNYRSEYPLATVIIQTEISEFYNYKYLEQWKKTLELDNEKHLHNTELYMIWAEKSQFLKLGAEKNPFRSEFFLWCDIGYFRNTPEQVPIAELRNFPNIDKIKILPRCRILMLLVNHIPLNKLDGMHYIVQKIGGGMFGGFRETIAGWANAYDAALNIFFTNNIFAGQDQLIMRFIIDKVPNLCLCINSPSFEDWFLLHRLLA
jgi:hypothetical protein